ncbi:MAG: hypothetical protein ACTSRP_05765 [Candidatus Helarchaeota archaeon]
MSENRKIANRPILWSILFYGIYGLLLVVISQIEFPITISVPISEDHGFTQFFTTQLGLASLIELILNTPFIAIFFFLTYTAIEKLPDKSEIKYKTLFKLLIYVSLSITILGVGIHFTANLFNTIKNQPVTPPDPTSVLIYWLDEIVGHFLIHIGIFIFYILLMIREFHKEEPEMVSLEFKGFPIWGFLIGGGFGIAVAEGQCSKFFIIVFPITILTILLLKKFKYNFSFKNKRIIWFNIFFYIGNIVSIIILGIIASSLGYAFFVQPHLLF